MQRQLVQLLLISGLYSSAMPALAHHAFAAVFDREAPLQLTGTVTRVEWMNPHVWFYIEIEQEDGEAQQWGLEMGSPNSLARRGWRRSTLQHGTPVNVIGYRAKDGSLRGAVETVTLESGERLFGAQVK